MRLSEKIGKFIGYTIVALVAILVIALLLIVIGYVFQFVRSAWSF